MQEEVQIGTYRDAHRLLHRSLLLPEAEVWRNLVLPDLFVNRCEVFLVIIVDLDRNDQEPP